MKTAVILLVSLLSSVIICSQNKSLVNTSQSKYAVLENVGMGDVKWTSGFWAERFAVCKNEMIPELWKTYHDPVLCHSFKNFEIAAGLDTGSFEGPSFHDGDFYKTLEAVAAMYASTRDPGLDSMMDKAIAVIAKAQRADGYVYTKSIIEQKQTGNNKIFDDKLSFEAYNFGHLMTAACVHYRATGKTSLLKVAVKSAEFLLRFYNSATPEQTRNAICPSHYMGIIEIYRTTHDERFLQLAKKLIDLRGTVNGTDDNSDRVPFRQMKTVDGHAVRANYLFAGVADLYAETGDSSLLSVLNNMWDDVVKRKMYITGGCGALYDGVSPDGTAYMMDTVQEIHQAYGKAYQLPNFSAHNETCANIGNLLWNWRMLQITGDAKYADIAELELYNAILSGISLEGNQFFYTNPLAASDDYPYQLRWSGGRQKYISLSNCCPPNVIRTIAEVNNYVYSINKNGLYCNLYGGNRLSTIIPNHGLIQLEEQTNYPWSGAVTFNIQKVVSEELSIFFRIPGWCSEATIKVNGSYIPVVTSAGTYAEIKRKWNAGEVIELNFSMPVQLMQSNSLAEENANRIAVQRGPVVYCAESTDLPKGKHLFNIRLSSKQLFNTEQIAIEKSPVTALQTQGYYYKMDNREKGLYQPLSVSRPEKFSLTFIPYYAWANRGHSEMAVWMPFNRN